MRRIASVTPRLRFRAPKTTQSVVTKRPGEACGLLLWDCRT